MGVSDWSTIESTERIGRKLQAMQLFKQRKVELAKKRHLAQLFPVRRQLDHDEEEITTLQRGHPLCDFRGEPPPSCKSAYLDQAVSACSCGGKTKSFMHEVLLGVAEVLFGGK